MKEINKVLDEILKFINNNYFYVTEKYNGKMYLVIEFKDIKDFLINIKKNKGGKYYE